MPQDQPVLVIGAASLDRKGRVAGTIVPGVSNAGIVRRSLGGVARNVAENLARLGVKVSLMTAVGDDPAGQEVWREARNSGIDTSLSLIVDGGRTGAYLAVLDSAGALHVAVDDMAVMEALTPRLSPRPAARDRRGRHGRGGHEPRPCCAGDIV